MSEPRFPEVTVHLTGVDSNVYILMGMCTLAMRRAGISKTEIDEFRNRVTSSSSYDEALRVMMETVDVV